MKQLVFVCLVACSSSGGAAIDGGGSGGGGSDGASGSDAAGSGSGGGSADAGPDLTICDETQTSDLPGVTRQCTSNVFYDFDCNNFPDQCGLRTVVADFYNMYGLTPWYGEYAGAVTVDPATGLVSPTDTNTMIFGAKYASGNGMDYVGSAETVCIENKMKYISLRLVPNTARTIRLIANASYELAKTISISTTPGQFTAGGPGVVCSSSFGGSNGIELTDENLAGAGCKLTMGQTYFVNFFSDGVPGTTGNCTGQLGATFTLLDTD
jgi:hypothetical protein